MHQRRWQGVQADGRVARAAGASLPLHAVSVHQKLRLPCTTQRPTHLSAVFHVSFPHKLHCCCVNAQVAPLATAAQTFTKADGSVCRLMFNRPVQLMPGCHYMLSALIKGSDSICCEECLETVVAGGVKVQFQCWESPNGTNETRGQVRGGLRRCCSYIVFWVGQCWRAAVVMRAKHFFAAAACCWSCSMSTAWWPRPNCNIVCT